MKIQSKLKKFRREVLQKTLQDLTNESGTKLTTISQFENGKSRNINHIKIYAKSCEDDMQFSTLIDLLKESLEEVRNGNTIKTKNI